MQLPKFLFKAEKPEDPRKFIGRTLLIPEYIVDSKGNNTGIKITDHKVVIESIRGNIRWPTYFEINGQAKYRISMLRFYDQMHGGKIPEEELYLFDIGLEVAAEKLPEKDKYGKEIPRISSISD